MNIAVYGCFKKTLLPHNLVTLIQDFPSSCFSEVFTKISLLPTSLHTTALNLQNISGKSTVLYHPAIMVPWNFFLDYMFSRKCYTLQVTTSSFFLQMSSVSELLPYL